MSRPGVETTISAAAPPVGVPTDTSVAFILGEAAQGPTDAPTRLTSLDEFTATYGDQLPGAPNGYNAVDAFFHESGTVVYFMRLVDGAVLATASAASIVAGNTLNAASPGTWGNAVSLEVATAVVLQTMTAGEEGDYEPPPERLSMLTYPEQRAGALFTATVKVSGSEVAVSPPLATQGDLANFLALSGYARLVGTDATVALAAGTVQLAGGTDGVVPVASTTAVPDACAAIPKTLGPGQLLAPGKTSSNDHGALLASAEVTNRYAILDGGPNDASSTLLAAAALLRPSAQARHGMLWGPWAVVPGLAPGTFRQVPWSALQAGIIARNDLGGNPNQAAAGQWGVSQYAVGLTRNYTDTEAEQLLLGGVDTARTVYGAIQAYAYRSLVDPAGPNAEWREANHGRLAMALVADSDAAGQAFVFAQLDGRGHTVADFGGTLAGICLDYYNDGALYAEPGSDDPSTAFVVNVGPAVNTPEKLADQILSAVLSVRMSPSAELVRIQIVKYPITVSLV